MTESRALSSATANSSRVIMLPSTQCLTAASRLRITDSTLSALPRLPRRILITSKRRPQIRICPLSFRFRPHIPPICITSEEAAVFAPRHLQPSPFGATTCETSGEAAEEGAFGRSEELVSISARRHSEVWRLAGWEGRRRARIRMEIG